MEFNSIEKKEEGKFITRYDITYTTVDHKKKVYEMISRNKNLTTQEELSDHPADSVVLIMHDKTGERLLLNREFMESAARELREETGLTLVQVNDILGESFSAIGFSNEKNVCVVGVAEGEFAPSTSTVEEIEARWYTKSEVRKLLKEEYFAARTQSYCYLWSKE